MKIAVLGGGVSGLSAARYLHDKNCDVTLYEMEDQVGGLSRSRWVGEYIFNIGGGHSLSPKLKEVIDWVFSIMPREEWNYRDRAAKIYIGGEYVSYPFELSLHELPIEQAVECAYDYIMAQQGEEPDNFRDWLTWNFGKAIADYYLLPYNTKIWNYPLEKMETGWVRGKMPLPEKKDILRSLLLRHDPDEQRMPHTKLYYPMRGGIQTFLDAVAAPMNVKCNQPVQAIEKRPDGKWMVNGEGGYDLVVSTIPLPCLPNAMEMPENICAAIRALKFNSLTTIFFSCPDNGLTDLYIPEKQYKCHRICFSGKLAPDAAPEGKNCGGIEIIGEQFDFDPETYLKTECVIPEEVCAEKILDSEFSPFAYVIHDTDYRKNTALIRDYFAQVPGFELLGRWGEWNYNNMDLCIRDGLNLGKRIIDSIYVK